MAYTYTSLIAAKSTTGSIKSWVNYDSIPSTDILTEAEAWIYETLRAREMRTYNTYTLSAGNSALALPSDFLDPISLTLDGDAGPLDYIHESLFDIPRDEDGAQESGKPTRYTIMAEQFLFDTECDDTYIARLWYYEIPTALGTLNTTNFLTRRFPTLLRTACMAIAYDFLKRPDERDAHLVMATAALQAANLSADRSRRGQIM